MKKSLTILMLVATSVAAYAQNSWKPYTSKEGAFTATFPGYPKIKTATQPSQEGYNVTTTSHMFSQDNLVAYVIYNEMEAGVNILDDSLYLVSSLDFILKNFKRDAEFVKDISVDGFPGKHFLVSFDGQGVAEGKLILRTNRAYIIMGFFPDEEDTNREKFLNSFRFLPYAESTWKNYKSKDYFFSVDFPSNEPTVEEEPQEDGDVLYTFYGLDKQSGNNYSVAIEKYSPYAQFDSDTAVLDQRTTWRFGDNIESEKYITVGGRLAKELIVNMGSKHFKMKMVSFTNGNLGYSLFAFLPESEMTSKVSERFFSSFKFTGTVPGDLFSDKSELILKDIQSNDTSVWYGALGVFDQTKFDDKYASTIQLLIRKKYPEENANERNRKKSLLNGLSKMEFPGAAAFVREIFPTLKNPLLEKEAMNVLATDNSPESNTLLIELLGKHKPVEEESYSFFFSEYRLDSLYQKEFFFKTLPYLSTTAYKAGIYGLANHLLKQNQIKFADLTSHNTTLKADFKRESEQYLTDSTFEALHDLIAITGYDKPAKADLDILKKLAVSYNDYVRIGAYATLLRQAQKVNSKDLSELVKNHFNRLEMFSSFEQYNLLEQFPKAYLRQDSLAVSDMYSYVSDEYFGPSDVEVVHREERTFNGKPSLFFVLRFREDENSAWYRGVSGPYTPGKLSVWADVVGSNFEEWDPKDKNHAAYLKEYLKDF